MTAKQRIQRLEKTHGTGTLTEFTCWLDADPGQVTARPANGQALTFETRAAMTAYFDRRDNDRLTIVEFIDEEEHKDGDT